MCHFRRAPLLKSLRLISCSDVTREGFMALINKFPLLEELELSLCSNLSGQNVFEVIAKSCPKLKHFLHIGRSYYESSYTSYSDWNGMAMSIAGMHGLRSLELHGNLLNNQGLIAIIDNCHYLELLILRDCPNVIMDNTLLAKCARIHTVVMLRGDEYGDHYQVSTVGRSSWSFWSCFSCFSCNGDYDYLGDGFFVEDLDDYNDYSRYLNGVYVTDLDDEEYTRMLPKCERRYLKISTDR